MAKQVLLDELEGCKSYFEWMYDKINDGYEKSEKVSYYLCLVLYDMDFRWDPQIMDDEIRAKDALKIRQMYSDEEGQKEGKSERDIDRIRKSIHGKTSVIELILSLCMHLDEMLNEDEPGSMIGKFFRILTKNIGLDDYSDEDFEDFCAPRPCLKHEDFSLSEEEQCDKLDRMMDEWEKEKSEERNAERLHRQAEIREIWGYRVKKWLDRDYFESGMDGGIFPLERWKPGDKDQRDVSLWYQMNAWMEEHLDEDCRFFE